MEEENEVDCGMPSPRISKQLIGSVICIAGVLILTPDTLLIRLVQDVPNYTVQFVKFAIFAIALFIPYVLYHGNESYMKFVELGKLGFLAGLIWGISNVFFINAVQQTYVGNVLVILASAPMFAALFSYIIQRHILPLRTGITCVVAFGVVAMVFLSDGTTTSNDTTIIVGNILALLASITMGLYYSILQYIDHIGSSEPNMIPVNIICALVVTVVALCFGGFPTSPVSGQDMIYITINSVIVLPFSFVLLAIGPQYVPAAEVALFSLIETICGPIWVYLAGFEAPPRLTIYGGVVLVFVLGVHSVLAYREEMKVINGSDTVALGDTDLKAPFPESGRSESEVVSHSLNISSESEIVIHCMNISGDNAREVGAEGYGLYDPIDQ